MSIDFNRRWCHKVYPSILDTNLITHYEIFSCLEWSPNEKEKFFLLDIEFLFVDERQSSVDALLLVFSIRISNRICHSKIRRLFDSALLFSRGICPKFSLYSKTTSKRSLFDNNNIKNKILFDDNNNSAEGACFENAQKFSCVEVQLFDNYFLLVLFE